MGDSFVQRFPFRPLGLWCTVRAFSRLFLSFPFFSCFFLSFRPFGLHVYSACLFAHFLWAFPAAVARLRAGSCVGSAVVAISSALWGSSWFGTPSFSVGVGVGSRVFWRLAGVVFWPRLFWLCVIGTRILLRFARKKKSVLCTLRNVQKCIRHST